mgnify:CR=1 FL=1
MWTKAHRDKSKNRLKMNSNHASWTIHERTATSFTITDVGHAYGKLTITNDAEYVVKTLFEEGWITNSTRLLYYDSNGDLGELLHKNGVFKGFKPA